jgi:hypothetical protein
VDARRQPESGIAVFRYVWGRGIVPAVLLDFDEIAATSDRLRINVIYTDLPGTRVALRRAVDLAIDLEAETEIIVPHVVPYPLALECPAVPLEFTCRQLATLAGSAGADPYIHIYLCRDTVDLLKKLLPAGSIAVIGTRHRWILPTRPERVAGTLRKNGCDVLLVQTG